MKIRACFFDMDSTVIKEETLPLLAEQVGLAEEVSQITEQAMRGDLDFTQALTKRVALLRGVSLTEVEKLNTKVTFSPGIEEFARVAKNSNVPCYLVSGGFFPLVEWVAAQLKFSGSHGNRFEVDGQNILTGKVLTPFVDSQAKKEFVEKICRESHYSFSEILVVGDGANDLPMLALTPNSVGFNAKTIVREKVSFNIEDHRELIALMNQ